MVTIKFFLNFYEFYTVLYHHMGLQLFATSAFIKLDNWEVDNKMLLIALVILLLVIRF